MHRITASLLAVFVVIPAWGDARLPVVNVASTAVSARAAFGESGYGPVSVAPNVTVAPVTRRTAVASQKTNTRNIASRTASTTRPSVDAGEKIANVADVLIPHRPSSDLWVKSDMPLRMPSPEEFSVLTPEFDLPEENLDMNMSVRTVAVRDDESGAVHGNLSEFDNQIARIAELQRRADESIIARPSQIVAEPMMPVVNDNTIAQESRKENVQSTPVKLSRLVVPMDNNDVIVRSVEKNTSPTISSVRNDMTKMSPSELRRAFRKTFLSENKHLSTFQIDDRFDVASDMSRNIEGFTAVRDLSESGGIRPLEIKIHFRNEDSALSRDNYTLLTEYASIVVSNPKRAIQVAIPESVTNNADARKLAARRLAIIEQVLRDTGVAEHRVLPVLSSRSEDAFVLRIISNEQFESMTQQQRNMFGDSVNRKTYKNMSW